MNEFNIISKRQIYYRRKEDSIIIEGKQDGKSILIWTLPNDPTSLLEFLLKASYFEQEKATNITEKVKRLDIKPVKTSKCTLKVRTASLKRTALKDDDFKLLEVSSSPQTINLEEINNTRVINSPMRENSGESVKLFITSPDLKKDVTIEELKAAQNKIMKDLLK